MQPHAYQPASSRRPACALCGQLPGAPVHLLTLPGMDGTHQARESARQLAQAAELTAAMRQPLADVSAKTGQIERDSPLFFGTGDNPSLF